MTVSLTELKRNAKLQSWYEDIEERKSRNTHGNHALRRPVPDLNPKCWT
jgi:hypothetical protein